MNEYGGVTSSVVVDYDNMARMVDYQLGRTRALLSGCGLEVKGFNRNQPRGKSSAGTNSGSFAPAGGMAIASPHQDDQGLSYTQAIARINSPRHQAFLKVMDEIHSTLGIRASNVIHGACMYQHAGENISAFTYPEGTDHTKVRAAGAALAYAANQKEVLIMKPDEDGDHAIHHMLVPEGKMQQAFEAAEKNLTAYTLMPDKENPNKGILIIAENQYSGSLRVTAGSIASSLGAKHEWISGTVEFLGDPNDRTQARENLRREASQFPALRDASGRNQRNDLRGNDGQDRLRRERGGNHLDHWRAALDAASPKAPGEGRKALGGIGAFPVVDSLHHSTIAAIDYNNMAQMVDYQLSRANVLLEECGFELKGFNPNQPRGKSSAATNSGSFIFHGGWPSAFPTIEPMTSGRKLKSHPDYKAGKKGDFKAATRVVEDIANRDKVAELGALYPRAKVVPVHAIESAGVNQLPARFADFIAEQNKMDVVWDIVQTNEVHHTDADAASRFINRAQFDGPVEQGRDYIIADDFVTTGGTASELRQYIEHNGGRVVAVTSLAVAGGKHTGSSNNIAIKDRTLVALKNKFGKDNLHDFLRENNAYNGNIAALTENEGRWLLRFSRLDNARDRIAESRSETKSDPGTGVYASTQSGARRAEEEPGVKSLAVSPITDTLIHYGGGIKTLAGDPPLHSSIIATIDYDNMAQMLGYQLGRADALLERSGWELKGYDPNQPRGKSSAASNSGSFTSSGNFRAVSPREFVKARNQSKRMSFLSDVSPDDLKEHSLYLAHGGKVGYALDQHDDLQNVFNNGGPKGAGGDAIIDAIKNGAKTLDCFSGYLSKFYARYGFVPTGYMKFNDDFAPKDWDYEQNERPDIIFMAYQGGDRATIEDRVGTFNEPLQTAKRYYADWDSAKADSRTAAMGHDPDGQRDHYHRKALTGESSQRHNKEHSGPLGRPQGRVRVRQELLSDVTDTLIHYGGSIKTLAATSSCLNSSTIAAIDYNNMARMVDYQLDRASILFDRSGWELKEFDRNRARGKSSAATNSGSFISQGSFRSVSPREFVKARNQSKRMTFLSEISTDDLKEHRLFLAHGGKVGYAIDKHGDLQNVFNNGGPKGAGGDAVIDAIKNGATTLDCFNIHLPDFYARYGFAITGRMKFNDEFAPKGWDYELDKRPDIIFMAYQGGDRATIENRVGTFNGSSQDTKRYYTDWDSAKADSRAAAMGHDADRQRDSDFRKTLSGEPSRQYNREHSSALGRKQETVRVHQGLLNDVTDTLIHYSDGAKRFAPLPNSLHHLNIRAIDYNNMAQMVDYQLGRAGVLLEGSTWELKGYNPNQPRGKSSAATNSGSFISTGSFRSVSPREFVKARNQSKRMTFLSEISTDDLKEHRLFLAHGGKVGYALDKHGDLQNVFNNGGPQGAGKLAVVDAVKRGALTLDCFNKTLPEIYAQCGFKETGRIKFNPEFAPPGWDYERDDMPDIIFMAYQGGDRGTLESRLGTFTKPTQEVKHYYTDWDSAKADSRAAAVGHDNDGRRDSHHRKTLTRKPSPEPNSPLEWHHGRLGIYQELLTTTDTLISYGSEIKNLEETSDCWRFGGWLVVFGSHDSSRFKDKFTAQTDFDIEDGERRGLYYNHGLDGTIKRTKLGDCRVYVKAAGVWIEGQIRKRTDYLKSHAEKIAANIESFGLSSGAPAHLVERKAVPGGHEILLWPLAEASITPTPAEPLTGCFSLKALVEGAGHEALGAGEYVPGCSQSSGLSTFLDHHSAGLRDGLAFDDHCARVLAAVGELQERVDGLAQMRCVKSGRRWSAGKFETLGTLADGLGAAAEQIHRLAEDHAPGGDEGEVLQALARFEALRARMNGVG